MLVVFRASIHMAAWRFCWATSHRFCQALSPKAKWSTRPEAVETLLPGRTTGKWKFVVLRNWMVLKIQHLEARSWDSKNYKIYEVVYVTLHCHLFRGTYFVYAGEMVKSDRCSFIGSRQNLEKCFLEHRWRANRMAAVKKKHKLYVLLSFVSLQVFE